MATLTNRLGLRSLSTLLPSSPSHRGIARIFLSAAAVIIGVPVATGVLVAPPLALWLRSWKHFFERRTLATFAISPPETPWKLEPQGRGGDDSRQGEKTSAIDKDVLKEAQSEGKYVMARERVVSREPIGISRLKEDFRHKEREAGRAQQDGLLPETVADLDAVLNVYLRTTMSLFARYTPQGHIMRLHPAVQKEAWQAGRDTFSVDYLSQCDFAPGDIVCGVYVVERRESCGTWCRVIMRLRTPPDWKGPAPSGVLDLGVEVVDSDAGEAGELKAEAGPVGRAKEQQIRFINETVLWRIRDEKPVFLETWLGRWLHSLMAAWFVVRGSEAVLLPL